VIKRILLSTDLTTISRRAEEYGLEIARATGAEVHLLHVIEPIEGATDEDEHIANFIKSQTSKARVKADKLAAEFAAADVTCEIKIEPGRRGDVILQLATDSDYDLAILGSHMMRDGAKVYVGTTTHKVFFQATFPLLVVPFE
jgi:nucleotide-binding universal stress UspA family protein